jgi:hypothetical protein
MEDRGTNADLSIADDAGEACKFQIVSPPFACGIAWLVNALIALDIKTTHANFGERHWEQKEDGWSVSPRVAEHLKWHLPILHAKEKFMFPEAIDIRWEHRLDFANSPRPTILVVRDPRDAIYSLYRRNYAPAIDFIPYLNRPDEWPQHFPGLFQLPPFETYTYFSKYWLAMSAHMPVQLIHFEDVKLHPEQTLDTVLEFIGISRSPAAIQQAIASSGFESAHKAMTAMERATGRAFKTVRKAQSGEWNATYSPEELANVSGVGKAGIQCLGYKGSTANETLYDYDEPCCRHLLEQAPASVRSIAWEWLEQTESGSPPSSSDICQHLLRNDFCGKPLLLLASIVEAIFYTRSIFADTSSPPARTALFTFAGLNMKFFGEWQIQYAAWLCLQRMENETQLPVCRKVGKEKIFEIKEKERLWAQ